MLQKERMKKGWKQDIEIKPSLFNTEILEKNFLIWKVSEGDWNNYTTSWPKWSANLQAWHKTLSRFVDK